MFELPDVIESVEAESEVNFDVENVGDVEQSILDIIAFLKSEDKSITSTHKDWLNTAYAIQSVLPNNIGKDLYLQLCRLDNDKHDEAKSIEKWDYCLKSKNEVDEKITIRTLFYNAKNAGYELNTVIEPFWYFTPKNNKDGGKTEIVNINQSKFNNFLERHGLYRVKIGEAKILVRNINNILTEVNEVDVKDFVFGYIKTLPNKISEYLYVESLKNKIMASHYTLFNKHVCIQTNLDFSR